MQDDDDSHRGHPVFVGYIDKQAIFQNARGYCDCRGTAIPTPDFTRLTHPEDQYAALVELTEASADVIGFFSTNETKTNVLLRRLISAIHRAIKAAGYDYMRNMSADVLADIELKERK